jgi:hypothetical protein
MTKASKAGRTVYLPLRLTEAGAREIDTRRGTWSRSEWVRQAISLAARQGLTGPPSTRAVGQTAGVQDHHFEARA